MYSVISVAWIYGVENFIEDIKMMMPDDSKFKESKINWIVWKILWKVLTPGAIGSKFKSYLILLLRYIFLGLNFNFSDIDGCFDLVHC